MVRKRTPKWLEAARTSGWSGAKGARPDWLSRALARAGVMPQREAEAAIRAGRLAIEGRVVREPMAMLWPGKRVFLDGRPLSLEAPETVVLMFHKPAGVVVSGSDPEGQGTVFDRLLPTLPPELARYGWHAVGRLDRNTTGLLLFTNDPRFVEHATRPETHLPKRYVAEVQGEPDEARLEPLRHGITLDDGPAAPAEAHVRAPGVVELVLREGRFHQVKRMLAAVGLPVRRLHREAVGTLVLDVPEGAWRRLTGGELGARLAFAPQAVGEPAPE